MSDIFREVDEDVRKDQLLGLWKRYGTPLLIAIGVILIVVAGWQFLAIQKENRLKAEGGIYTAAEENTGDLSALDRAALYADIAGQIKGGYATLAKLREAAAYLEAGQRDEAVAVYDALAAGAAADQRLADLAGLLAAESLADHISAEELEARVAPLALEGRPFAPLAKELLAVAALERDDLTTALALLEELADDTALPQGLRGRATQMRDLLQAAIDQGTDIAPLVEEGDAPAEEAIDLPVTIQPAVQDDDTAGEATDHGPDDGHGHSEGGSD